MNTIPIAFAFDNNLSFPACVCLSSLMMHAKPDTFYDIFILHSEKETLRTEELNKLPYFYSNCRITYRTIDSTFDKSFEIRGITTSTYYRLLIPQIIPEYKKIIYSDVDVIFRDDLSDIYLNTDMNGCYVAGVNSLSHLKEDTKKYYQDIIGIESENIIYAGNIIINSELILKDNIIPRFKECIQYKYRFQDMDIINIVCKRHIQYLPPCYCLTTDITEFASKDKSKILDIWTDAEIQSALKRGIVHYNGKKPWSGGCINFDIWWEYYRKSPYYCQSYYFDFFNNMLNELDRISLWKRIKILARYFIHGRK